MPKKNTKQREVKNKIEKSSQAEQRGATETPQPKVDKASSDKDDKKGDEDDIVDEIEEIPSLEDNNKSNDKWRFQRRSSFFTWSACDWKKEDVLVYLKKYLPILKYAIGEEHHMDGSPHLHAFLQFSKLVDTRNVRYFDLPRYPFEGCPNNVFEIFSGYVGEYKVCTFHPNLKKVGKKNLMSKIAYTIKDMKYIWSGFDLFVEPTGFTNRHRDWTNWMRYRKNKSLTNPFPFRMFYTDEMIQEPVYGDKCHNYIILSDPNSGTTEWMEKTFEGKAVYFPQADSKHPYDSYDGQPVIIFDDHDDVSPTSLIEACDVYKNERPIRGDQRYMPKFWPVNQVRFIIFKSNYRRKWMSEPRIRARFRFIDIRKPDSVIDNSYMDERKFVLNEDSSRQLVDVQAARIVALERELRMLKSNK